MNLGLIIKQSSLVLVVPYLDTMIVKVSDDNVPFTIDGNEVRSCKLTLIVSPRPKLVYQLPVGLEDENAGGFVVHNVNQSVRVHGQPLWT